MMKNFLALIALLMSSLSASAETPNDVKQMYPLVMQGGCQDNESKEQGQCYLFAVGDGTFYMVFAQKGNPVFMRRTLREGGYVEVWRDLGEPV